MPLVAAIAAAIGTDAAASATLSALRELSGLQDEQLEALQAIQQDVQVLREGPWHTAKELVADAGAVSDNETRRRLLERARDELYKALGNEPAPTPRRAAVAVDLALVHALLGERELARRRARAAHADQAVAVAAAVPTAVKALSSRGAVLKAAMDGDFWSLVGASRKKDAAGTQRWVREKYEQGEIAESLPPPDFLADAASADDDAEGLSDAVRRLTGARGVAAAREQWRRWHWEGVVAARKGRASAVERRPFLDHVAIAETTTAGGRELMRLHRMRREVHQYREVCRVLDPHADVPVHELIVDLSEARRAVIVWRAVSARTSGALLALWRSAQGARVSGVAYSSDGRHIAVASGNAARVLDSRTAEEVLRVRHPRRVGDVWGVAFSPDGGRLATAGADHTGRIWDARTGRELLKVRHLSVFGFVRNVAFSPDSERLLTAGGDRTARVWSAADGRQLLRVEHGGAVWGVAFSPDGRRFASTSEDRSACIWGTDDGRRLLHVEQDDTVMSAAFSPDGRLLALVGPETWILDAGDGRVVTRVDVNGWHVAFSPGGGYLAIAAAEAAHVVRVPDGAEAMLLPHDGLVTGVAFSPDGEWLATSCIEGSARVWELRLGTG